MSDVQEVSGFCSICSKPKRNQRDGSLTGWIFGGAACSCALRSLLSSSTKFAATELPNSGQTPSISNRYKATQFIDKGSMSNVWKAWDEHLEKYCVVKLQRAELTNSPALLQRFTQEARTCARFSHANLVPVTDFGMADNGSPFLVMDLIDGSSLRTIIESQKLTQSECLSLTIQLCKGLQFAHDHQVIHRDLKPENILVALDESDNPLVKIIDFGIARIDQVGGEIQRLTTTGEIFGSASYMSPEQCFGVDISSKSDIYSLGCILYELLSGHPPFRGTTLMDVLNKQIKDQPLPIKLRQDRTPVPKELSEVVSKCLNKNPDERFASMSDLQAALKNIMFSSRAPKLAWLRVVTALALLVSGFTLGFFLDLQPKKPNGNKSSPGENQTTSSIPGASLAVSTDKNSPWTTIERLARAQANAAATKSMDDRDFLETLRLAEKQKAPAISKIFLAYQLLQIYKIGKRYDDIDALYNRLKPAINQIERAVDSDSKIVGNQLAFVISLCSECSDVPVARKQWYVAEERILKALKFAKAEHHRDAACEAFIKMKLGHVYLHSGRVQDAERLLQESKGVLSQHPEMEAIRLIDVCVHQREIAIAQHDYKKALELTKEMRAFRISLKERTDSDDQEIATLAEYLKHPSEAMDRILQKGLEH